MCQAGGETDSLLAEVVGPEPSRATCPGVRLERTDGAAFQGHQNLEWPCAGKGPGNREVAGPPPPLRATMVGSVQALRHTGLVVWAM